MRVRGMSQSIRATLGPCTPLSNSHERKVNILFFFEAVHEPFTKIFVPQANQYATLISFPRPFVCPNRSCNKSFIQRSALTVHMRTHSGERPHICEHKDCGKKFSDSSSLARHRSVLFYFVNPAACPCPHLHMSAISQVAPKHNNLMLNASFPIRRIHTGKRPYKCLEPKCGKCFVHKTILTKHMKMVHDSTFRVVSGVLPESQDHNITEASSPSSSSGANSPPYDTSIALTPQPMALPSFQRISHTHLFAERFHSESPLRTDNDMSKSFAPRYIQSDYTQYSNASFHV
ncbi:hypothetical protein INT43_006683 [Umbelopsis isabellina]|uniref:C2H2-type domain-containing protein n=1 Tax=Mortierella isabellina TaxID=91625 RepID=A0A8H7Q1N7_MORIS|nr:hypothetical protein INT43_006683 [Umbelopsis isabellina]